MLQDSQPLSAARSAPRGRFVQLLMLACVAWAMVYARYALGPLQEAMKGTLALTDNQVAWLLGPATAVLMALGSIPLGLLADRQPRIRLLLCFTALDFAANVLTALAFRYAVLIVARCLIGLAQAALTVALYSLVADLYVPAARGRANMLVMIGEVGGSTTAFALGGILLAAVGQAPWWGFEGWRWALLSASLPLLPTLLLIGILREPTRTGRNVTSPPLREVWPQLRRHGGIAIPLVLARMTVWIADGAVFVWAVPMFARNFGLSPERIGALMGAALLVGGVAGALLGGPLADYCQRSGGPRYTLWSLATLALLSAPLGLFAFAPTAPVAGLMLAGFLTLGYIIATAGITIATIVIPGELRGFYLGVSMTVGTFCFIGAAPLVVSGLSGVFGGEAAIGKALAVVCAATSLLGAVAFAGATYFAPKMADSVIANGGGALTRIMDKK